MPKRKSPSLFHIDYKQKDTIMLSSQYTLRKLIGILGVLLPFTLILVLLIDNGHGSPLFSISHYYFTRACSVFVLVLGMMGIFLLVYKGEEPVDFWISTLAGIAALFVVLFPTDNITYNCPGSGELYSVTLLSNSDSRVGFHYISAGIFLLCLAIMAIFLFTKSNKPRQHRTKGKKIRNKIYIICGVIMILSILVIVLGGKFKLIPQAFYEDNHLTFWMETVAVESFGVAWLVKGGKWK